MEPGEQEPRPTQPLGGNTRADSLGPILRTQSLDPEAAPSEAPASGFHSLEMGEQIARGGMGTIHRAFDTRLNRTVAVKRMSSKAHAHRDGLQRFLGEAQVTGQLEHPGIVPVHEVGLDDEGQPFYVMKLLDGQTLLTLLRGLRGGDSELVEAWPLSRLIDMLLRVCEALEYAHSRGVIHRDLKPDNIMVGAFGEVQILDWGLAKVLADDGEIEDGASSPDSLVLVNDLWLTQSGSVMGTPGFMSPEQLDGEAVDERTDVFSLGCILYEVLTLNAAYTFSSLQELRQQMERDSVQDPSDLPLRVQRALPHVAFTRIPRALSSVAMRAMKLNPEQRYQQVAALRADLLAWQSGFATDAEAAGPWKQAFLFLKRNARVTIPLALISGILMGSTILALYLRNEAVDQARVAEAASETARSAQSDAESARQTQAQEASMLALRFSNTHREDGEAARQLASLARALRLDPNNAVAQRMAGMAIMDLQAALPVYEGVAFSNSSPTSMAVSPDGTSLALGSFNADLMLVDVASGEVRRQRKIGGMVNTLCFSPDGSQLAVGSWKGGLHVLDGTTLKERFPRILKQGNPVAQVEFRPDGESLLVAYQGSREVFCCSADNGEVLYGPIHIPPRWDVKDGSIRFRQSPKRDLLMVNTFAVSTLQFHDLETGELLSTLVHKGIHHCFGGRFFPDQQKLISFGQRGTIVHWDMSDPRNPVRLSEHGISNRYPIETLEIRPDGARYVSACRDGSIQLWGKDGSALDVDLSHAVTPTGLAYDSNGRTLYTRDQAGVLRGWDSLGQPTLSPPIQHGTDPVKRFTVLPSSSRMVTLGEDRKVLLWDLASRRSLPLIVEHGQKALHHARFTPDGQLICTASTDGSLRMWDAATGLPAGSSLVHQTTMSLVPAGLRRFSPVLAQLPWIPPQFSGVDQSVLHLPAGNKLSLHPSPGTPTRLRSTVFSADLHPHRNLVAHIGLDMRLYLVDLDRSKVIAATESFGYPSAQVRFLPNGEQLVVQDAIREFSLYQCEPFQRLREVLRVGDTANTFAVSPDGTYIAATGEDFLLHIRRIDDDRRQAKGLWLSGQGVALAMHPDSTELLCGTRTGDVQRFDLASRQRIERTLQLGSPIEALTWHPAGESFAVVSRGGVFRLIDRASLETLWERQLDCGLADISFSPEGDRLLVAGDDGTARVFDLFLPAGPPDTWFPEVMESLAGQAFDGQVFETRANPSLRALRAKIPAGADDEYARMVRWFLADAAQRPISPFSRVRGQELALRLAATGRRPALAERAAPNSGAALLAVAKAEPSSESRDFFIRRALAAAGSDEERTRLEALLPEDEASSE